TDKRNPTVNAYGPLYGTPNLSTDMAPVLDPIKNTATEIKLPVRDPNLKSTTEQMFAPSPYWGEQKIWYSQALSHNPMFDSQGRVWFTPRIHDREPASFCKKGANNPSAKLFPIERAGRQLILYDPKTNKFTTVDTCFSTHHLQMDAQDRIWASSGTGNTGFGDVVGWFDIRKFDET